MGRAPGCSPAIGRELGFDAVTHGFRSSFRDRAAEQTHTPHAVMEAVLAHTIKNKAVYARSDVTVGSIVASWLAGG